MLDVLRATCVFLLMAIPLLAAGSNARAASFDPNAQPLARLKSGDYETADRYFADMQHSYESGKLSDQQLYEGFRALYEDAAANARYFDQWVQAHPDSYVARVARGAYNYRMAWAVRDGALVAHLPVGRLKRMQGYLALARPDLQLSLKLTAKPYLSALYLLNIELLDGTTDARRRWLDLGTSIDPTDMLVRRRYLIGLEPDWGGSFDQMRAFIDECAKQNLPPPTMAELKLVLASDLAEAAAQTASPKEMLGRWDEVIQLAQAAGEPPPPTALGGYAISASDLNRREDADRVLAQLAQMDINDGNVLSQMGWIYVREQRNAEAWKVLTKGAQLHDAWSELAVGETLFHGCAEINLARDWPAALTWIRRSANQGNAEAVILLSRIVLIATLFLVGLFFVVLRLAPRYSTAAELIHQSSERGSPPPPAATRPPEPLHFSGSGAEYFGIWIVNLLLTILTLGIYSAWAKVRRLQYFYRHTELAGSSFDFHGSPIRIFIGRLIALAMLIAYHYSVRLLSPWTVVVVVALAITMPWLLRNSFRFRLYNSSWRGARFHFRGSPAGAYRVLLLNGILTLLTLYTLAPFTHQRLKAYQHDNSWFGRTRFSFHATAGQFYWLYLLWLIPIAIMAILFRVVGFGGALIGLAQMQQQGGHLAPYALLQVLLPLYIAVILVWFTFWSTFHALVTNLIWNNTRLGDHRLACDMSPVELISINAGNFVLVAITLGLFIPWATIRLARFQLNSMRLLPASDLQDFTAADPEAIGAVGEEAAGAFDFDISL